MNTRSPHSKAQIMESPALRLDRSCYRRRVSPANPREEGANIKIRIQGSLSSLVLAASRRTYRHRGAFRVASYLWAMATVRPLRFLGVLLVLYAMVGWYHILACRGSRGRGSSSALAIVFWRRRVDRRRGVRADNAGSSRSDGPERARERSSSEVLHSASHVAAVARPRLPLVRQLP